MGEGYGYSTFPTHSNINQEVFKSSNKTISSPKKRQNRRIDQELQEEFKVRGLLIVVSSFQTTASNDNQPVSCL